MRAAVEHLVQHHGRRRVVFLAGTPGKVESETPLTRYREVLAPQRSPSTRLCSCPGPSCPATDSKASRLCSDRDRVRAYRGSQRLHGLGRNRSPAQTPDANVPRDVLVTPAFDDLPCPRMGQPGLDQRDPAVRTHGRKAIPDRALDFKWRADRLAKADTKLSPTSSCLPVCGLPARPRFAARRRLRWRIGVRARHVHTRRRYWRSLGPHSWTPPDRIAARRAALVAAQPPSWRASPSRPLFAPWKAARSGGESYPTQFRRPPGPAECAPRSWRDFAVLLELRTGCGQIHLP